MAALERIAAHLRAVLASHVSLQLVNGRGLWPPHDFQSDGLMRIAAEAADFAIDVTSIEGASATVAPDRDSPASATACYLGGAGRKRSLLRVVPTLDDDIAPALGARTNRHPSTVLPMIWP